MKRLAIAILVGAISLTACSSDSDTAAETTALTTAETTLSAEPTAETTAAGVASADTSYNDVDVRFAQGGLGHHAQAVELAEIALDPKAGAQPEILELGKAITAPSPEFDAIEELLTKWGKPLELSKEEMAKMEGMATPATVETLATLNGAEFNKLFLTTLVSHHEGAIKMAEKVLAEGTDAELKPIAEKLLQMRTGELVLIKGLLG